MPTVLIFGDSITWGAWDSEGGWVARLRKDMDKRNMSDRDFYCPIYNLGISGDTTEWLLTRFENEIKQRVREGEKPLIIIDMGANDSILEVKTKKNRVPEEKFKKNIDKLIRLASKYTNKNKILFVGFFLADENKSTPVWWENIHYKNDILRKYNEIVKNACKDKGIAFIDIISNIENQDYTKLILDGVHPNDEGHKTIYKIVREKIWELIE